MKTDRRSNPSGNTILRLFAILTLMIACTLALSSNSLANEYEWCPDGGEFVDRFDCITIEYTDHRDPWGQIVYRIRNSCNMTLYFHVCYFNKEYSSEESLCSDPPQPTGWFRVKPTTRSTKHYDHVDGHINWWAVSCE